MGWNSWNKFACNVSEDLIRGAADSIVRTGRSVRPERRPLTRVATILPEKRTGLPSGVLPAK